MTDETTGTERGAALEKGTVVYDHEGEEMGVIVGMTGEGFEAVTSVEIEADDDGQVDVADLELETPSSEAVDESLESSEQEQPPGQQYGEGYIMWRCHNCGEMGELDDGLPTACPDCGSDEVVKWRED